MPTLYLAIDARKAKEGAKEHEQATDAIDRGAKKAGDAMDKLKERTGKAWDILKAMFKGMVAGAAAIFGAVSAFTALNVATASAIDNLTDTAQALQLTVEQVSLLEYAADRAGTNLGDISGAIRAVAAQAQAASFTTDATLRDKLVVFEIEPEVCMDIAGGFRSIAIQTGAANVANITRAELFVLGSYQGVSPPSTYTN